MLTKRCTLYCREQLKNGKDIGFPGRANSWLVCSLHFPQVWKAVRCGGDPERAAPGRETAILINYSQTAQSHTLPETWAVVCHLMPPCSDLPLLPFQHYAVCSFSAEDRHWCRDWFVICQSALAAASWLAEREMLWCLPAVGVFLQGQKIPSCSPLLQPSPMGWDVWSWPLSSHLVNQNKLREFSVFSLLMPLNVYFFSQLYCKFWVMLDCAYIVGYLKLWDAELSLDCSF